MAHSKRRLPVPLSEDCYGALMKYSQATGSSMGATAALFLEQMAPQIVLLADAINLAKTDPVRGSELLQSVLKNQLSKLEEDQLSIFPK